MIFEFNLLGILILFILLVLYFTKENKDKFPFKLILLTTYITELFYILTFIGIESNNYNLSGRLYFLSLVILFTLFTMYNAVYILNTKYKNKLSILEKKLNLVKVLTIIISMIFSILILTSKMYLLDDRLVFGNNILNIILSITIILDVLMLIWGKVGKLYPVVIIKLMMLFISLWYPNISVISEGVILITLYIYLIFENYHVKELETTKLERDYAYRNMIDKYAFLKNLSHEIRTPINTIDGFSQVIQDSNELDGIKEDIKDIRTASHELIDIINNMIDLSIIESGNLEIINDNYNIYDMFDNIKNITKSKMKGKLVKFEFQIEDNIPEILLGDQERISQVILNLLGNSIKFTEKGKITLNVSCIRSNDKVRLIIKIIDTGIGFTKEQLLHIFDKKEDNSIGLVLSNHLITMMNGKIDVESKYNEGSTFTITIDQKIIKEKSDRQEKNTKPFKAEGKRILLVDDNKMNLKVASKLLVPYMVEVVEVNSGKECLDILDKDTAFDLILMDDLMPNMSGTETLDIIKKIARIDGFYIPVVVLTANATSGVKEKYLQLGFDDYLAKPIEKDELNRVLKKYLKGKKKNSN